MQILPIELRDKAWRITHLYKIKNKSGALITFRPNNTQVKYIIERRDHRRNLILKYRQGGVTTLHCIDFLDECLWVPGISAAILAHEREATDKIFQIVKRAFVNLPEKLKPTTNTDTKRMYQFVSRFDGFPLDSSIYVAMKLRGGTVQKLHISEAAWIKDRQELDAGSKQAVPIDGDITEETTGNGINDFYDVFMESWSRQKSGKPVGPLEYKAHFFPWFDDPEYSLPGDITEKTNDEIELQNKFKITDGQLLWRRWKMGELKRKQEGVGLTGAQLFKQEYPATVLEAFQSGAGSVFDPDKTMQLTPKNPLTTDEGVYFINSRTDLTDDKRLTMIEKFRHLQLMGVVFWELPEYNKKYNIGVDPSDGGGSDNTCVDVWENDDIVQVAQFYGKVRPDEAAEIAADLGFFYNEAYIGVENNMLSCILFLSKIYPRYYFETRIDERTMKRTKKIGWSTNTKTRDPMIDDFNLLFDEDNLTIHSPITIKEMRTFVKNPETKKRESAPGRHDDSLFAAFIAIQMRQFNKPMGRVFEKKPF